MKRFTIEQSQADIISHSGLALIGQAVQNYTRLSAELDAQVPLRHGIKHSDVIKSYLGMMSLGKGAQRYSRRSHIAPTHGQSSRKIFTDRE